MNDDSVAQFLVERKEALLSLDIEKVRALQKKWSPSAPHFVDAVVEIGMHKARTGAKDIPEEAREISREWLRQRGYTSFS